MGQDSTDDWSSWIVAIPNGCRLVSTGVPKGRSLENRSGQGRGRTGDTRIFSPLLYQLSYLASKDQLLAAQRNQSLNAFRLRKVKCY
jgi:hypothetical protein